MTHQAIVHLVTKLYAAAGAREATDVDFETYAEALEDVADQRGLAAARELIRNVDLVRHRPSPALVRDTAHSLANREYLMHGEVKQLPEATGQPVTSRDALAWINRIRTSKRRGGDPAPISESLPVRENGIAKKVDG